MARLAAAGTTLLTPDKTRTAPNLAASGTLASTRLVIESVFSNLKQQMQLERHLARTPARLAVRIAQRILALTLAIRLNTLNGRPARALAAHDAAKSHCETSGRSVLGHRQARRRQWWR